MSHSRLAANGGKFVPRSHPNDELLNDGKLSANDKIARRSIVKS